MSPFFRCAFVSMVAVWTLLACGEPEKVGATPDGGAETASQTLGKACSTDCQGRSNCGSGESCDGICETCPCQGNCVASAAPTGTLGKACMAPCDSADDGCGAGQECTVTAPCVTCPCEGTCAYP